MMPKVGVVLSGCGFYDGAEIQEAVITMLALDRAGAEIILMAPNIDQLHVVNHLTGKESVGESRNVLVESARIARGNIRDLAEVNGEDLDALIFPGGYGVAKNLCDYAMVGANCAVNPDVYRLALEVHRANKPIGVICIAPAMMARILGEQGETVDLTIGYKRLKILIPWAPTMSTVRFGKWLWIRRRRLCLLRLTWKPDVSVKRLTGSKNW